VVAIAFHNFNYPCVILPQVNLLYGTKQSTARDFKIVIGKLQNMPRRTPETDITEDADADDSDVRILEFHVISIRQYVLRFVFNLILTLIVPACSP